jgi:hypothetical protein
MDFWRGWGWILAGWLFAIVVIWRCQLAIGFDLSSMNPIEAERLKSFIRDLKNCQLHVFRNPTLTGGYKSHLIFTELNAITPLAFPELDSL